MQIIPVLDLKAGRAVHAVRGRREQYAPVKGVLGSGGDPLVLARAYRDQLGCATCYVADLDGIAGLPGHTDILQALVREGLSLWVDAGVSTPGQAASLVEWGVARIIIGSETLSSPTDLLDLAADISPTHLVLSVDLQQGVLRAPPPIDTPPALVDLAGEAGINQIILLDLARVGAAAGPPLDLLLALHSRFPQLAFYAGGGVRHRADLEALARAGAAGALVATAFHRGVLTAVDIRPGQPG